MASPRPIRAFASDLDRTLLRPYGRVSAAGRSALREARALGLATILVSGRELGKLRHFAREFGEVDAIVAENGAVVEAPLNAPPVFVRAEANEAIRHRIARFSGLHPRAGVITVSVPLREIRLLRTALRGLPVRLIENVDRVTPLPPGIDKGTGARTALLRMGLSGGPYAALGDAENDLPLLRGAALSGAVANAQAAVRVSADYVCERRFAAGALEFVRGPLALYLRHKGGREPG